MSAVRPEQFPPETLPEFAFLGRSNVGKSSLLNALAGQKGLAHTSSTPGRTQSVNFFAVADRYRFVDLPGYGHAAVSKSARESWKSLIEAFLTQRNNLALCFLLLDSRRGWMPQDLELRDWLDAHQRRHAVVATKFDKLGSQSERHAGLARLRQHGNGAEIIPFSAVTGQGVREIWQTISKTMAPNP
ncbi:MAG: ribosome biogenesis GTP-binding protein YihA/YsxC [Bryobacteraceae bacterium]